MCAFMYMARKTRRGRHRSSRGGQTTRSTKYIRHRRSRKGGDDQCPNMDCSWADLEANGLNKTDVCSSAVDRNGKRAPCGPCRMPQQAMDFLLYAQRQLAAADQKEREADAAKDSAKEEYVAAHARRKRARAELVAAREGAAAGYKDERAEEAARRKLTAKTNAYAQSKAVQKQREEAFVAAKAVSRRAAREADAAGEFFEKIATQKLGKCSSLSQQEQNVVLGQLNGQPRKADVIVIGGGDRRRTRRGKRKPRRKSKRRSRRK